MTNGSVGQFGLMLMDECQGRPLVEVIQDGVIAHRKKLGTLPTACTMNRSDFERLLKGPEPFQMPVDVPGASYVILVRPSKSILRHHFFLADEQQEASGD